MCDKNLDSKWIQWDYTRVVSLVNLNLWKILAKSCGLETIIRDHLQWASNLFSVTLIANVDAHCEWAFRISISLQNLYLKYQVHVNYCDVSQSGPRKENNYIKWNNNLVGMSAVLVDTILKCVHFLYNLQQWNHSLFCDYTALHCTHKSDLEFRLVTFCQQLPSLAPPVPIFHFDINFFYET